METAWLNFVIGIMLVPLSQLKELELLRLRLPEYDVWRGLAYRRSFLRVC